MQPHARLDQFAGSTVPGPQATNQGDEYQGDEFAHAAI